MSDTTPSKRYQSKLNDGFTADPVQAVAISHLDALHKDLMKPAGLFSGSRIQKGLYLHGQVGIGKTFLMDIFFDCLPEGKKQRLHFHQFMQGIHLALKEESGHKNPLGLIGERMAKDIDVLCLDELFITDIADGMIICRLFESLFRQGVVLVTTSNFPPDRLYNDDLQPHIFQPAIDLIMAFTAQIHLNSSTDYRMLGQKNHQTYYGEQERDFAELFDTLSEGNASHTSPLVVCDRPLEVMAYTDDMAWFTFDALCQGPRSQRDYLQLSQQFGTLLLSGIPQLTKDAVPEGPVMGVEEGEGISSVAGKPRKTFTLEDNAIRRFISLVDVLYDNGNMLYLSAAAPLDQLYQGGTLQFEFKRTRSRITEMQSLAYWQKSRVSAVS